MKRVHPWVFKIQLWISLVAVLFAHSVIPEPAEAMFVPSTPHSQTTPLSGREADMATIQKTLESKTLQQRLVDYGLSPESAFAKINDLSDEQVHFLAKNIEALQAGGMSSSSIIIILLLILIVLLLI